MNDEDYDYDNFNVTEFLDKYAKHLKDAGYKIPARIVVKEPRRRLTINKSVAFGNNSARKF